MLVVEVVNLTKKFGKFIAVDGISFTVEKGEIFGFLGPNGAGKSTTIRMLCGILTPTSGRATVVGFDLATQAESLRQNIGYMSQRFSLYDDLSIAENVEFYAGIYGLDSKNAEKSKQRVLRLAGLEGKEKMLTAGLSKGWKQRLALGCALVHEPSVLFLDEPTSGVDPLSRRRFWDLIRDLSHQGTTVFVTTHFMDEAENCNHIAFIAGGKLVNLGTPTDLKRQAGRDTLEEAFVYYAKKTRSETQP